MMDSAKRTYMDTIFTEDSKFCIIALTGKVRAGTSDICNLLTDPDFPDSATQPADTTNYDMSQVRENKIVYRYLHHNWRPFVHLSITDIIVSFILDAKEEQLGSEKFKIGEKRLILNDILKDSIDSITIEEIYSKVLKVGDCIQYKRIEEGDIKSRRNFQIHEECQKLCEEIHNVKNLLECWRDSKNRIEQKEAELKDFAFCFGYLSVLRLKIRGILEKNNYTIIFQKYGNNIRAYGSAITEEKQEIDISKVFSLPERVNHFIKLLRFYDRLVEKNLDISAEKSKKNPVFVVINNFKNIFEAYYFKKRYSAFYLIAVSCDENERKARFEDLNQYRRAELQENLSSGKRIFKRIQDIEESLGNMSEKQREKLGLNEAEQNFADEIRDSNNQLLLNAYKRNIASFILQDVVTCVENADIFVTRNYKEANYKCDYLLIRQLARIVTLILHPGLLKPTKLERCMQIAMAAKLNSGCLSRQVGAVVTDSEYNILSIGWNDAPCGAESCIRRNLYDLFRKHDPDAYSQYELENEEFRQYLEEVSGKLNMRKGELKGLPLAFCFKDIFQDIIKQRDQIYTRALHGEERALVSCDSMRAQGGYLFTTSSPCELCAKKAKDAKISKIYYIEQYPGISLSHIIRSGSDKTWAAYELFVGAVGSAYVKLYTPVIPYKDELAILNFTTKTIRNENQDVLNKSEDQQSVRSGGTVKDNREQENQIQQEKR